MCGECNTHIGYVIYDCLCLVLGSQEMRDRATDADARVLAAAAEPVRDSIKSNILVIADDVSDRTEKAESVFTIVNKLYSSGCLFEVYKVWVASLPAKDAVKYTAKALKTLIASFATDGAALLGVIIVELATFKYLIEDSIECKETCGYA